MYPRRSLSLLQRRDTVGERSWLTHRPLRRTVVTSGMAAYFRATG